MDEEPKINEGKSRAAEYQDPETGKFMPGNPGGGRPKGTFSPLTWIKKYFDENPEKAEAWLKEYLEDPKNRQHLFNQIEGMPKQRMDIGGELKLPFVINIQQLDEPKPIDRNEGENG